MPIWLAEAAQPDVANVVAVDPDRARVDVPEPREQVHEGGLAAAVGADQGDRLAVADGQAEPWSDGLAAVVAEMHVLELDRPAVPGQADGAAACRRPGARGPSGADPVGRRGGPLDLRVDVGELADRVGDAREHRVKVSRSSIAIGLRGELELEEPEVQEDRLVEHQVRSGQQRDRDGRAG